MLSQRDLDRTRESLETFLARVRPSHSQRAQFDISYQLSEQAFVLSVHHPAAEAAILTAHPHFKAVHIESPSGWQLYIPDAQGHWAPCPDLSFVDDLEDALDMAEVLLPKPSSDAPLSVAI